MDRNAAAVGTLLRERRDQLGLSQDEIPGVSAAMLRKLENGTGPSPRAAKKLALMRGLGWPADGMERLYAGEDPAALAPMDEAEVPWDVLLDAMERLTDRVEHLAERLERQG